jgi:apolipoprotein N-acyltransferase
VSSTTRNDAEETPDPRPLGRRCVVSVMLAVAHAVLFLLAFPPWSIWPAAFVAVMPLALMTRFASARLGAAATYVAAVGLYLILHAWQREVSAVGYPISALYMAVYPALFVLLLDRLHRRLPRVPGWLLPPLLWVGLEVVRGELMFTGYAFFLLAHPTVDWLPFPQCADLVGTYGVSLLALLPAGVLFDAVTRGAGRRRLLLGAAAVILVGVLAVAYGSVRIAGSPVPEPERSLRCAAIQTNVPQSNKLAWTRDQMTADFTRAVELTAAAVLDAPTQPDVVVWPETMLPTGFGFNNEAVEEMTRFDLLGAAFASDLKEVQRRLRTPMIVGASATDGLRIREDPSAATGLDVDFDATYNSAFAVVGGRVLPGRYDKQYLTPFGEVIPYLSAVDALERAVLSFGARGMKFDLSPGTGPQVLTIEVGDRSVHFGTPICFEVTSAWVCRRLTFPGGERRAEVLLNLTNDGWFGASSGGRRQHLQAARFRCIELRTPMLRSANTGISAAIDSAGRLLATGPDNARRDERVDGVLHALLPYDDRRPWFARGGWVFPWCLLFVDACLVLLTLTRFRKER